MPIFHCYTNICLSWVCGIVCRPTLLVRKSGWMHFKERVEMCWFMKNQPSVVTSVFELWGLKNGAFTIKINEKRQKITSPRWKFRFWDFLFSGRIKTCWVRITEKNILGVRVTHPQPLTPPKTFFRFLAFCGHAKSGDTKKKLSVKQIFPGKFRRVGEYVSLYWSYLLHIACFRKPVFANNRYYWTIWPATPNQDLKNTPRLRSRRVWRSK